MSPSDKSIVSAVGSELKADPPGKLAKTARKVGIERSKKQKIAILLNKSRAMGAKIPPKKTF